MNPGNRGNLFDLCAFQVREVMTMAHRTGIEGGMVQKTRVRVRQREIAGGMETQMQNRVRET